MKKHIKNLIATIAVATFLLGGGSAFASGFIGSYSGTLPPSELTTGYTHYLVKDNGIQPYFYYYNGNLSYGTNPAMPPFQPMGRQGSSLPTSSPFSRPPSGTGPSLFSRVSAESEKPPTPTGSTRPGGRRPRNCLAGPRSQTAFCAPSAPIYRQTP